MEYILGKVVSLDIDSIIFECNNIGYKIFIKNPHIFLISNEYKIFIIEKHSFINSNISIKIFGFLEEREKILFEKIIIINGIGPKNAFHILRIDYDKLIENIKNNNADFFILENKINKKITESLLRNIKIDKIDYIKKLNNIEIENKNELIESLRYLGFTRVDIDNTMIDLDFNKSVNDLIKISIDKIIKSREEKYE